ncbi:glutathione S-transferase [Chitinasiproducens palmae]|uniref:Glutathione S-transferase n=1 Tax=Chitinasiproducens palmae TaxID=1770053 RepID=A0A1H2PIM5_9BURK|nr:glutathione S-transferase [Chitinasiproducens palmae]SDV46093.1 Glutathione S-transferase [Chitinasiproducens palmae]
MKLYGMLDSPYVRRVAISLRMLDIAFEQHSVSVFSAFDQFHAVNPVVKAPTLVLDDGATLMDSTLILDYLESIVSPGRRLLAAEPVERFAALQRIGLALAACEKTVQIVYEHNLRPSEKQHQPWLDRVHAQLAAAYRALEVALVARPPLIDSERTDQASLTAAVAWRFTAEKLPGIVDPVAHPALQAWSVEAEALPAFLASPYP